MNPVLKRIITALSVATVVVLALIYVPIAWLLPVIMSLIILVHLEFSVLVSRKYPICKKTGVIVGALYLASLLAVVFAIFNDCILIDPFAFNLYAIPVAIFIIALCSLFSDEDKPIVATATTVLGFLYIPVLLSYLLIIPVFIPLGGKALLYVLATIKISDMGGFAFGMSFGKHKMCPKISPKKSWEGFAGSIFASCLISCSFMPITGFSWIRALLFGVVAATIGTLGDLVESRFKRDVDVKDSSQFKWTNGMGGFLDMFDSLIFAPALLLSFFLI